MYVVTYIGIQIVFPNDNIMFVYLFFIFKRINKENIAPHGNSGHYP